MREILFRGQRIDNGEWVYGYIVNSLQFKGWFIDFSKNERDYSEEIKPETVSQFTGLLDKKGNKIFEGDKLNIFWGVGIGDTMEVVSYDNIYGYFKYGNNPICELIEDKKISYLIIGNIHEK